MSCLLSIGSNFLFERGEGVAAGVGYMEGEEEEGWRGGGEEEEEGWTEMVVVKGTGDNDLNPGCNFLLF